MADIVNGLFGIKSSQERYKEAMDAAGGMSPAAYAQLTPDQRITADAQRFGQRSGIALSSMLGGKTSAQVQDQILVDALNRVNEQGFKDEPSKLRALAAEIGKNPSMLDKAQALLREADKVEKSSFEQSEAVRKGKQQQIVKIPVQQGMKPANPNNPLDKRMVPNMVDMPFTYNDQGQLVPFTGVSGLPPPPGGSTTLPPTGAGAGRGFVNPPLAAQTQPVTSTAPAATTTLPPAGQRGSAVISEAEQAAIAEARRKAQEQAAMTAEVDAAMGRQPQTGGGLQNAEPEAMPMEGETPQTNFSRGEMEKKKQLAALASLLQKYKKAGIDTTQIEQMIAYLRKQLGNSWGNEVRN